MTGALPSWHGLSDADLAVAAARGDRRALAGIYDRYADRLYDYCVGTVGDREAAADCVQDVFCVAATNLASLREPDKLRPWLYSIARHHAMRRLRERYREQASDDLPDTPSTDVGPDTIAGQSELAMLVAEAAGGLSDRDRELLELTYRHGMDGPELAAALGVTLTNANTMVFRLRKTIERSLGALLVARGARANRHACPDLSATLQGWDGQFTVLMRKRVARHIESCPNCEQEQRRRVSPAALLGGAPLFIPAPKWLKDATFRRVQLTSASTGIQHAVPPHHQGMAEPTERLATDVVTPSDRHRRVLPLVALVIGIPLSVLGFTMAWLRPFDTPVTTAAVGATELQFSRPAVTPARTTPSPGPTPLTTSRPVPVTTTRPTAPVPTPTVTTPSQAPVTTAPRTTTSYGTTPPTTTDSTPATSTTDPYYPRVTTTEPPTTDVTTPDPYYPPVTTTPPPYTTPAPIPTPIPTPSSVVPDGPVIH